MISVIIPARNEKYLAKTIDSALSAAEGKIEVIAICDGYWPDPPIKDDPRVTIIHHTKAVGQRPAINEGARIAKGKYILKADGHCMFDQGFDVKLAADCEYDWTVIPRQYQLDAEKWEPKWHKKTDCMFFRSPDAEKKPFRIDYYDARTYREHPKEYLAYKKAQWRLGAICDTMASLGACFFMHKERFWELGGLDENHAHWGQMGVEIACKSWLSGGRQVINKKTWFAHQWRRTPPWKLSQKDVDKSRQYSIDFWTNNKWPDQKKPLSWLVEKFAPVPSWNGQIITSDLTLLYYTSNRISEHFSEKILSQLRHAAGKKVPIISVTQKPMDFGENICIGDIGRSFQNIYKQVLIGAKKVNTEYVALVEDDCLYVPEHFDYRPKDCFAYNLNRWCLHQDLRLFSYRKRPILSQCIAPTKLLIECLEPRMKIDVPKKYCGEMGLFEKKLGLKEYPYETFETKEPNVVVCHNKNTGGRKYIGKDAEPRKDLAPWGNADVLLDTVMGKEEPKQEVKKVAKYGRGAKLRMQHSYIGSIVFPIEEIMENLMAYADNRKKDRAERRMKVLPAFIEKIADEEPQISFFEEDDLRDDPWFDYLCELYPTWSKEHRERRVLEIMQETIIMFLDIKDNGLKAPLDMWREGKKLTLHRGWRRLIIMDCLHKRGIRQFPRVCVRLFKSKEIFRRYNPSTAWKSGPVEPNSIHDIATRQFTELNHLATDKYWVHSYTRHYDRHLSHLRDKKIKILEIGVFRGASLLLWKHAFPKALVYGIDKNTAIWQLFLKGQKRIKVFVGRQEDEKFLAEQVIPAGPFDVIIDDGGHMPEQQLPTFRNLWPHLNEGGQYILEDLHGNYWKRRAPKGPLMMTEIKNMIDGVNDGLGIMSVSSYYNITFIEKI